MKKLNLQIKHKILLLIISLIVLLSISMIASITIFSNEGKKSVLNGVADRFEGLKKITIAEFNKSKKLADQGIKEASGMVSIEKIISIAQDNQKEFNDVIQEAIQVVGNNVAKTLESQDKIVSGGLDNLLANSTDSMNEIMEFDNNSQNVLANVAIFNANALKVSSLDSLGRLTLQIQAMEKSLEKMQDLNNEEIDTFLVDFIGRLDDPGQEREQLLEFVMEAFNNLKEEAEKRKNAFYKTFVDDFGLQARVMAEELNLVTNKIHYAINRELEDSTTIQQEKTEEVITKLLENQMNIQTSINKSSNQVGLAINELKTSVPMKLKEKGNEAGKKIEEKSADARKLAKAAEKRVAAKVDENTRGAAKKFEASIAEAKNVIEGTLNSSSADTIKYSVIIAVLFAFLAFALSIFIIRGITNPITKVVGLAKKMSKGDLTSRVDVKGRDEISNMCTHMNDMSDNLQNMFKNILSNSEILASSSTELADISQQMSSGAKQTSEKSNNVAAEAEEMSSNMNSVASATEEASTNVNMVAAAAEEMTATINEIARNTEEARTITNEAVSEAKGASDNVDELGSAAREISKVTETITEISEQTNLLALNATIEAARAGDAGKGFAVVANEIKELARQTAEATQDIKKRIAGIQGSTTGTVTKMGQISKIINDVNDIVTTIASSVEEQSVTTKEIATNVAQASQGIGEVNKNVSQSSIAAGEIAKDISEVNQASGEIFNSSSKVNTSAEELNKLAEQLKEMAGRFKV